MAATCVLHSKALVILVLLFAAVSQAKPIAALNQHRVPIEWPAPQSNAARAHEYSLKLGMNIIHERMMPGLTPLRPTTMPLQMVYFQKITSMVPVSAAATFLEEFFSAVAQKAEPNGGEWSQLPERNSLNVEEGNFRLAFSCLGDAIPWSFVKEIAMRLWQITRLGAADLFEAIYMDGARSIRVQVSLTLIEDSSIGREASPVSRRHD